MKNSDEIVKAVQERFRTFGGDRDVSTSNNPIVHAMQGKPAQFAAGVDVKEVVDFIISESKVLDIPGNTPEEQWRNLEKYTIEQIEKIDTAAKDIPDEEKIHWWFRMKMLWKKLVNN